MINRGDNISDYTVLDELGSGGFGTVYKARHVKSGELAAVKILKQKFVKSEKVKEGIIREALVMAKLEHPNICHVKDFAIHKDGRGENYCIIMEFLDGKPLDEFIEDNGLIPPERATPIFLQILAGIGYAHQRGIVHRDIKPQNIMIMEGDLVKVMDFGIAKVIESTPVMDSLSAVSFGYVAPERILRQPVDRRSDIYSLGMVFYQILTGRLPFEINDFEDLRKHVAEPPQSPLAFYPYMPEVLAGLVLKAIEKDPEKRFQSCEEFAISLQGAGDYQTNKIYYQFTGEGLQEEIKKKESIKVNNLQSSMFDELMLFVGEKSDKYIEKFAKFTTQKGGDVFVATWHWPAFLAGGFWFLYRKMYVYAFLAFLIGIIPYINFILGFVWGFTANYIYFKHAKKKIAEVKNLHPNSDISAILSAKGGINVVAVILGITFIVLLTIFVVGFSKSH